MAEIRVEQTPKRSLAWLWILIVLALIAAAAWAFMNNSRTVSPAPATGADTARTSLAPAAARAPALAS